MVDADKGAVDIELVKTPRGTPLLRSEWYKLLKLRGQAEADELWGRRADDHHATRKAYRTWRALESHDAEWQCEWSKKLGKKSERKKERRL